MLSRCTRVLNSLVFTDVYALE